MQEVDKGAPSGRTCFDLLENALLTRIVALLSAKDLVRFAASCKRFAGLEKESSDLKHAQLCAHFTAAGAPDTVAWLTSNRGRVFSTFIVVTGAPYSVLERLVEAPERPPLLFPNSELFASLERHFSVHAKGIYAAMAHGRAVYDSARERGESHQDGLDVAWQAAVDHLTLLLPEFRDGCFEIWLDASIGALERRGVDLTLHYISYIDPSDDEPQPFECGVRLEDSTTGDDYGGPHMFDNDTNVWLLAAEMYLNGLRWLEHDIGREDAGYEWRSSSIGMETLHPMSENDPTLKELDVNYNSIGAAGASALAEALMVNKTLTTLYVRDSGIGDAGATALADALKVNKTLTTLHVYNDSIGAAGAAAIAEALKVNKTLATLDVNSNSIGDAGAAAIAEALKVNKTLATLDVYNDSIGAAGAAAIAEALKVNKTLVTLDVGGNSIGAAGASALAEALKVNNTLTRLDANHNGIRDADASAIAEALKVNETLTTLNMNSNRIGATGAAAIAEALKVNKTLAKLYVGGNSIGEAGARAMAEALKVNKSLTTMDINFNIIVNAGVDGFSSAEACLLATALLLASARPGCTVNV
jgi:Ran GTPase-activating protein (RanGAP) involved in mRNA processing and transport